MNPETNQSAKQKDLKKVKDYVFDKDRILGRGAFGKVYEGKVHKKNEKVAVKVIKK